MNYRIFLRIFSLSLLFIIFWVQIAAAEIFRQDFSSKEYCDTVNTTAFWDTTSGQLKLHPFSLELVGSYDTPSIAFRIEVRGPIAYIADEYSGLVIIDVSDPAHPEEIGNFDTDDAFDVAVSGIIAYVLDISGEIFLIDLSDLTNPDLIDSYDLGVESYSLEVAGNFLYVAGMDGLTVFEVDETGTLDLIGNYPTAGTFDLVISGNYAYTTNMDGLKIFDISDPANPDSVAGWSTPSPELIGLGISGNTLYVTTESGDFGAIDVTDPENINIGGADLLPDFGMFMDITGDYAYVAYYSGIAVVDLSDPLTPTVLYTKDIVGEISDVEVVGEYVYAVAGNDGLKIYRAAQPVIPPLPVGINTVMGSCRDIDTEGNYAYVGCGSFGVRVMDITDPAFPVQVGHYDTDGFVHGIQVSGNVAYVADGYGDFKILDVSDPTSPSLMGSYVTIGPQANDVAVAGDYAYVSDHNAGLYIFDITDPANPDSLGFYSSSSEAWGVEVAWPIVYLAESGAGLSLIDVSDPSSPNLIGSYDTPGVAVDVVVEGVVVFVADGSEGVHAVDVTDPSNPNLVGTYNTPDFAAAIAVDLPYVYVADLNSGVQVLDWTAYTSPFWVANIGTSSQAWSIAVAGDLVFYGVDNTGFYSAQVWERTRDIENNIGQSVTLHTSSQVDRIKLDTFPTDSIQWEASADNGANWEVLPMGAWHDLAFPGVDLVLRATLQYETYRHYPVCDSMMFELEAGIVSVLISNIDAAAEGSSIRIKWDVTADENIRGFNLYRAGGSGGLAGQVNGSELIPAGQRGFIDRQVQPGILYEYTLGVVKQDGEEVLSRTVTAKVKMQMLTLEQNYPNPFNPSTTISYSLPDRMRVRIAVYNPEGRLVKLLLDRTMSGGLKTVGWNGIDAAGNPVASGVYFYQLKAGGKTFTRKMMLIK